MSRVEGVARVVGMDVVKGGAEHSPKARTFEEVAWSVVLYVSKHCVATAMEYRPNLTRLVGMIEDSLAQSDGVAAQSASTTLSCQSLSTMLRYL